jgi:hypothetical protein
MFKLGLIIRAMDLRLKLLPSLCHSEAVVSKWSSILASWRLRQETFAAFQDGVRDKLELDTGGARCMAKTDIPRRYSVRFKSMLLKHNHHNRPFLISRRQNAQSPSISDNHTPIQICTRPTCQIQHRSRHIFDRPGPLKRDDGLRKAACFYDAVDYVVSYFGWIDYCSFVSFLLFFNSWICGESSGR